MIIELNIGLNVNGSANSMAQCRERAIQAIAFLRAAFGPVLVQTERMDSQYEGPNGLELEPTLYVKLDSPLDWLRSYDQVYELAEALGQDCIAMYCPRSRDGEMVGPGAAAWPDFDFNYFKQPADVSPERKAA